MGKNPAFFPILYLFQYEDQQIKLNISEKNDKNNKNLIHNEKKV